MKHSWKFLSLCVLLLLCGPVTAEPEERLEELARDYGSHLAQKQAEMLARKAGRDVLPSHGSSYSLESDLYGGFGSEGEFRGSLDLFTGRRAIDETLQLNSVGSDGGDPAERTLSLKDLTALEVRSHPWREMLDELGHTKPARPPGKTRRRLVFEGRRGASMPVSQVVGWAPAPEILGLVPHDHFMVYFKKGETMQQLERVGRSLSLPLDQLFEVHRNLDIRHTAARRLGLEEEMTWEHMLGETVFVSEDLDFYPATHFALIFHAPGAELVVNAPFHGKVGRFYVVATSQQLLDRISACHRGSRAAMTDNLDFHYAWTVLDQRRDGMLYLSEAFILKLVGPAYRLNAARRRSALRRLAQHQYEVLAYRCLSGAWPGSFAQMQQEGYLDEADRAHFSVGPEGEVRHHVWGTLAEPRPLSEVPIELVSPAEKERYDWFRDRYQQFWTRFFDPIGVAFAVADRLYAHTIILPLIDNSQYRDLQAITGGDSAVSDYLSGNLLANEPVLLASRFDFDGLLSIFSPGSTPEKRREDVNRSARSQLDDESVDVYQCIGDEIGFAMGHDFSVKGRGEDIYAWLKLRDRERFHRLLTLPSVYSERKPLTHAGVAYYDYMGFKFFYFGDYLVVCFDAQATIERLCQAAAGGLAGAEAGTPRSDRTVQNQPLTAKQQRTLDYIGAEQNILFLAEPHRFPAFAESLLQADGWQSQRQLKGQLGYLVDVHLARQAGLEAEKFFRFIPERIFGVPVTASAAGVRIAGLELEHFKVEEFGTLLSDELKTQVRQDCDRLRSIGVGLQFTPEGLSTRVAISNPLQEERDPRFGDQPAAELPAATPAGNPGVLLLAILVVLLGVGMLGRKQS